MTRQEITHTRNLDFSEWSRKSLKDSREGLIAFDVDFIFMNYKTGYFIIVEVKTNREVSNTKIRFPQAVTYKMLNEMLCRASEINEDEKFSFNPLTKQKYIFKGIFLLEFINGTDPDNSEAIYLNGKAISKTDLIKLLNLEDEESSALTCKFKTNWIENNLK